MGVVSSESATAMVGSSSHENPGRSLNPLTWQWERVASVSSLLNVCGYLYYMGCFGDPGDLIDHMHFSIGGHCVKKVFVHDIRSFLIVQAQFQHVGFRRLKRSNE